MTDIYLEVGKKKIFACPTGNILVISPGCCLSILLLTRHLLHFILINMVYDLNGTPLCACLAEIMLDSAISPTQERKILWPPICLLQKRQLLDL
jgi:hypothetical protein